MVLEGKWVLSNKSFVSPLKMTRFLDPTEADLGADATEAFASGGI